MNEANKTNEEETKATGTNPQEQPGSDTHPICQNAKDQEKCEEFAERLGQANENINKRED